MYLIFLLLLFAGLKSIQRRTVTLTRLFIIPSLLVFWSFYGIYDRWQGVLTDVYYWIISLVCGSFIGWWMIYKWKIHIDRERKTLTLPGTWTTLCMAMIIFSIRYFFGYYYETHPFIPHSIFLTDIILSGIITGMFIGRSFNLWYRYENAL